MYTLYLLCKKVCYSFDIFVLESLLPLSKGLKIVLADEEEQMNPKKLKKLILKERINMMQTTPSRFQMLVQEDDINRYFESLSEIMVGGEAFPKSLLKRLQNVSNAKIYNMYGPTETTVWSTISDLTNSDRIDIGNPIANTKILILDENKKLQPIGIPGEIFISGECLSQGYLGKKAMTDERFLGNPFIEGTKMYRTGDIGQWHSDGKLTCLGRIDNQIKIRGFRIELEEIENDILNYEKVNKTAVVAREDKKGNKYLVAYFNSDKILSTSKIREFLNQKLPDYMIPSYFIQLDDLPMTPNGKIDRKALPEVDEFEISVGIYEEPDNQIEEDIINVWESILEVKNIGRTTNFFDIGGDSLKAIRVAVELQKNYEMKIADLFDYPTPKELANNISIRKNNLQEKIEWMKKGILKLERDAKSRLEKNNIQKALKRYEERVAKYENLDYTLKKNIKNIMITGATGFLGAHIVNEFLENNECNIYSIVRGKNSEHAKMRLSKKLDYYFGEGYYEKYSNRIIIFVGDLSEEKLGLDDKKYSRLSEEVEMIINSAANVRHFGPYEKFYKANVESVKNIVTLSKIGLEKDIYHISTTSVLMGETKVKEDMLFTEFDMDIGQKSDNVYVKSKFEAEKYLEKEMTDENNINILRVGNIIFNTHTNKFQENSEENAFYNFLKSLKNFGMVPNINFETVELSYVDYMAKAIRKISMSRPLENEIHHIYNKNSLSLKEIGNWTDILEVKNIEKFFQHIIKNINTENQKDINNIIIHSNLADYIKENKILLNKKTDTILSELGFKWKKPEIEDIKTMMS
ncbi:MAG: SDR family oxidoreductase [Fusobacteriota bacterium]